MPDLGPRYEHKEVEEKIYRLWEKSGYFNPDKLPGAKKRKPYCIIMPPPNANGALHIGHALFVTLEDIMTRFQRMRGRRALWLPGADHAGFETQVVFDKKLEKEGRNRFALDRETLWKEIWNFTQENKKVMENQLRRLGASCDWSRETFTLDKKVIREVYATFKKMHEDGLIYRDLRVVNWCPKHKTALSDLEVKYVERKDPLYYIKYGPLTLATVRPETKFGDTALAVNPDDKRYRKYIGKEIEAKGLLGPLKFKVIADEAVDPGFGTGVVKVTPAHDAADFEIWTRHKGEIPGPKVIIDENGRLTGETGPFRGLKVAEAREKVAEAMREAGILEKVEPDYLHQVATCYKCGNILEPLPKPQWFVKMAPLAKPALAAVKQKRIAFYPEHSKKVFIHWLQNIRDWNISRQIIWGIRIPAWFCLGCGDAKINPKVKSRWFIARHGETDWNKEGRHMGQEETPLNNLGREQAQLLGKRLKNKKIDLIISSDLTRCRETAEIIGRELGVKVVFDPRLREKHGGEWQGLLHSEIRGIYDGLDEYSRYTMRPPGGESFEDLEKRIWSAYEEYQAKHSNRNVVIVTHGGPMRIFHRKIKNKTFNEAMAYKPENTEVIELDRISDECSVCGSHFYQQDPDVFDTWFSSGQWPFITLGYPDGKDYKTFYPTDVLETAADILFFWVARMVMFGLYRTGKIPFRAVYLHGLVRDKDRQKMSKSKGNVIDPLGVADVYGSDAVRAALVAGNTPGRDTAISEDKIRGYRNFATKVWNIARFILMNRAEAAGKIKLSPGDKRRIAQARKVKAQVAKHIEKFEFHLALEKAYHYTWHTFADKIIEEYKPKMDAAARRVLQTILIECLTILHPFMPFVTEEIYQKMRPGELLLVKKW